MRMRWLAGLLGSMVMVGTTLAVAPVVHATPFLPPTIAPDASLSTTGDYASDVLGNPWDFSDEDDVPAVSGRRLRRRHADRLRHRLDNGILRVNAGGGGGVVRLVRNWGDALAWGHDGPNHPVDAGRVQRADAVELRLIEHGGDVHQRRRRERRRAVRDGDLRQVDEPRSAPEPAMARTDHRAQPAHQPGIVPHARLGAAAPSRRAGRAARRCAGGQGAQPERRRRRRLRIVVRQPVGHDRPRRRRQRRRGYVPAPGATASPARRSVATPASCSRCRTPFDPDRYHRFSADLCLDRRLQPRRRSRRGDERTHRLLARPRRVTPRRRTSSSTPAATTSPSTWPPTRRPRSTTRPPCQDRLARPEDLVPALRSRRGPGHARLQRGQRQVRRRRRVLQSYGIQYQDVTGNGGTADIYATPNRGVVRRHPDRPRSRRRRRQRQHVHLERHRRIGNADGQRRRTGSTRVIRNRSGVATGYSDAPVRLRAAAAADTDRLRAAQSPARLLDTRDGIGGNIVPLVADVTTSLQVAGRGGVPGVGATSVVLNVTVDHPSEPGVLTVWPSGEPRQLVSSMNLNPGDVAGQPGHRQARRRRQGQPVQPQGPRADGRRRGRLLHRRRHRQRTVHAARRRGGCSTPASPTRSGPGSTIDVQVTGVRGVPASGVSGVALNVTVDNPSAPSYFTVYPTGEGRPNASTLNFVPGLTVANLTLAKVGAGGKVSIWNYDGTARVVADVVGYFSASGGRFVPVSPTRVVDTRDRTRPAAGADRPRPDGDDPDGRRGQPGAGQRHGRGGQPDLHRVQRAELPDGVPDRRRRCRRRARTSTRGSACRCPNQDYAKLGAGGQVRAVQLHRQHRRGDRRVRLHRPVGCPGAMQTVAADRRGRWRGRARGVQLRRPGTVDHGDGEQRPPSTTVPVDDHDGGRRQRDDVGRCGHRRCRRRSGRSTARPTST